jgi:hypothetical protein
MLTIERNSRKEEDKIWRRKKKKCSSANRRNKESRNSCKLKEKENARGSCWKNC